MTNKTCLKSFLKNYPSSFILLNMILIITLVPKSFQNQVPECEKEFYKCNNMKCSKFSHCYYKSFSITEPEKTLNQQIFQADCTCIQGYDTYNPQQIADKDLTHCCYKLKDMNKAFIYECIIGFGLGYLYLENYQFFFVKFIFQMSLCCIVCFSGYCINFDYDKKERVRQVNKIIYRTCNIWNFILIFILIVWRIYDFFIFGLNLVKDANGMRLYNEW